MPASFVLHRNRRGDIGRNRESTRSMFWDQEYLQNQAAHSLERDLSYLSLYLLQWGQNQPVYASEEEWKVFYSISWICVKSRIRVGEVSLWWRALNTPAEDLLQLPAFTRWLTTIRNFNSRGIPCPLLNSTCSIACNGCTYTHRGNALIHIK